MVLNYNNLQQLRDQIRELEIELALREAVARAPLLTGYQIVDEAQQAH